MTERRPVPPWARWQEPALELPLRHAVRILQRAGRLEELIFQPKGPPLDRALQAHQRAHRSMGRNDRLLLGTALFSLARGRVLYRRGLDDAVPGGGSLLLLALLDHLAAPPGRVPHLPGGVSPWSSALARVERQRREWAETLADHWDEPLGGPSAPAVDALCGLFSIPSWWLPHGPWRNVGDAVLELATLKRPQHLVLRVQAHRASREEVLRRLSEQGIPAHATRRSPWGAVVEGRHNVLATDLYRDGAVEVQDEGSQLVACLCDPRPGERLLDLCAGGGGKSLALAAAMKGRGEVVAYDVELRRLADTRRRARRAGLGNIRVAETLPEVQERGPYDLVLADVPCTSSGTLRRNPDVAWRWEPADLERLVDTQAAILDTAATLVKAGGSLVFTTCSLLEAENRRQAEAFAARHPSFETAAPGERRGHGPLLDVPQAERGFFRLAANLPRYEGDAFFLARFRKRG